MGAVAPPVRQAWFNGHRKFRRPSRALSPSTGEHRRGVWSAVTAIYDARGNIYAVATPDDVRSAGVPLPADPATAAQHRTLWAGRAIAVFCRGQHRGDATKAKRHDTDGLLIGPFGTGAAFDLLVVNTDGTLAERSGNGLTIFAQALADRSLVQPGARFALRVHHDGSGVQSPTTTEVEMVAGPGGRVAFWLDLGAPRFGADAVGAQGPGVLPISDGRACRVARLAELDAAWDLSVFVRVGNPHCVTFPSDPAKLPGIEALRKPDLHAALARIAFAQADYDGNAGEGGCGAPCPAGVNLQWATVLGEGRLAARVFERGEGATASSGSSAAAVACAAWRLGLVAAGEVFVEMPGGTVPLRLTSDGRNLRRVRLQGVATACPPGQRQA